MRSPTSSSVRSDMFSPRSLWVSRGASWGNYSAFSGLVTDCSGHTSASPEWQDGVPDRRYVSHKARRDSQAPKQKCVLSLAACPGSGRDEAVPSFFHAKIEKVLFLHI